jgi:hypothetical protein
MSSSGPLSRHDPGSGEELSFETVKVDRSDQETYHGYLRKLEEAVVGLFRKFGIGTAHTYRFVSSSG